MENRFCSKRSVAWAIEWWKNSRQIRSVWRLTMLYTALLLFVVSLLLILLYQLSIGQVKREQLAQIDSVLYQQTQLAEDLDLPSFITQLELQSKGTRHYRLTFQVNNVVYGGLSSVPDQIATCPKNTRFPVWLAGYDEISFVTACAKEVKHGRVIISSDEEPFNDIQEIFISASILSLFAAVALGLITGLIFSFRVLAKVNSFNRIAQRVEGGDLQARIPVSIKNDEYDHMARHINTMLAKLETSFHAIQGATDAIAHDLRTPLGHLKQQIEFALLSDEQTTKQKIQLEEMHQKLDEILFTFTAMLELTRLEHNRENQQFEGISINEIIEDAVDLIQPLCEEKGQSINIVGEQSLTLKADRSLMFRVIYNLIENSCKYSGDGSQINVEITVNGFVVSDNGIGICDAEKAKVFDRLYRVDKSRTIVGFGLGLSLVRAIIHYHNGEVKLQDNNPGLKVVVRFPLD